MSVRMTSFPILINLLVNCIFYAYSLQVPRSPCPDIFQYIKNENGDYYGKITFPYTDGARFNISVGLAAWMPGYYPAIKSKHVELTMLTPYEDLLKNTTSTIVYHVDFPFKNAIPLISIIGLNNRVYCNGLSVPPNDGTVAFTTCGQTHHIEFPLNCVNNQPIDNEKNDQYLDTPLPGTNRQQPRQTEYIDFPPYYNEKPKPNNEIQYNIDYPQYGIVNQV